MPLLLLVLIPFATPSGAQDINPGVVVRTRIAHNADNLCWYRSDRLLLLYPQGGGTVCRAVDLRGDGQVDAKPFSNLVDFMLEKVRPATIQTAPYGRLLCSGGGLTRLIHPNRERQMIWQGEDRSTYWLANNTRWMGISQHEKSAIGYEQQDLDRGVALRVRRFDSRNGIWPHQPTRTDRYTLQAGIKILGPLSSSHLLAWTNVGRGGHSIELGSVDIDRGGKVNPLFSVPFDSRHLLFQVSLSPDGKRLALLTACPLGEGLSKGYEAAIWITPTDRLDLKLAHRRTWAKFTPAATLSGAKWERFPAGRLLRWRQDGRMLAYLVGPDIAVVEAPGVKVARQKSPTARASGW